MKRNEMEMPKRPSAERMAKAPSWVKEYIRDLEAVAEVAVTRWNAVRDTQTVTRIAAGDTFDAPVYVSGTAFGQGQVQVDTTPPRIFAERKDRDDYTAREWLTIRPMEHEVTDPEDTVPVQIMASRAMTFRMEASNSFIISVPR